MILLLPQSTKVQDFTRKKISLKKFTTPECLLGLVTAKDLGLDTTADDLFRFIINNLGTVVLQKDREGVGKVVTGADTASPVEMFELISKHIKVQDEETKKRILRSLDTSSFTEKELSDLVRNYIEEVKKYVIQGGYLLIYKDYILHGHDKDGKWKNKLFFFPQHGNKFE